MDKSYLIVATGKESKKSGKPYSMGKAIVKLDGQQFISDRDTKFINEYIEVGEVIMVSEEIIR